MEVLKGIANYLQKKQPLTCGEPPEPGVVVWRKEDPENPGLVRVCRTPEEKARFINPTAEKIIELFTSSRAIANKNKQDRLTSFHSRK